jgi:hypothetical protein
MVGELNADAWLSTPMKTRQPASHERTKVNPHSGQALLHFRSYETLGY